MIGLSATIPGLMISPDGTQETGVYSYLINPRTGDWFHRMFTPLTGQKLILDLFEKGYFVPEMTDTMMFIFHHYQKSDRSKFIAQAAAK